MGVLAVVPHGDASGSGIEFGSISERGYSAVEWTCSVQEWQEEGAEQASAGPLTGAMMSLAVMGGHPASSRDGPISSILCVYPVFPCATPSSKDSDMLWLFLFLVIAMLMD